MLGWLKTRGDLQASAAALHDAVVAEARTPDLYARIGVPDTLDGRLEMLILQMVLVLARLQRVGEPGAALARGLTEAYVAAMDDTMRAIGVGDLTVPRKVKKAAAKLYDRNRLYAAASDGASADVPSKWHEALQEVVASLDGGDAVDLDELVRYVLARKGNLNTIADTDLLAGRVPG